MATTSMGRGGMPNESKIGHEAAERKKSAQETAGEVMGNLKDFGSEVKERAADSFESFRETSGEYLEQGREKMKDMTATLEQQIRAQPITSLLVAVGVGF